MGLEPLPGAGGFLDALRSLPRNPLLRREWRALLHSMRARRRGGSRAWVLPAVLAVVLTPYFVWALLAVVPRRLAFLTWGIDILAFFQVLTGIGVSLLAVILMATTVAGERERRTWEALGAAGLSAHELLLGYLLGRLAPLLAGATLAGSALVLLRPHYATLVQPYAIYHLSRSQVSAFVGELVAASAAAGTMALAVSAWSRDSRTAIPTAAGAWLTLPLAIAGALQLLPALPGWQVVVGCALLILFGSYQLALAGVSRAH